MRYGLCLSLLLVAGPTFAQDVVKLGTPEELSQALTGDVAGKIIELAPGNYGELAQRGLVASSGAPLVIRSADPATPAVFTGLTIREAEHVVFDGIKFDYVFRAGDDNNIRPFQFFASRDITISNSIFEGSLDDGSEGQAYPTGYGLSVRGSSEVLLENNDVSNFYRGVLFNDVSDLAVIGNDIHGIRMDGLNMAQVERVLVQDNYFHDFSRALDSKDHSDMIQMWTNRTERPSSEIVIRANVLNSANGFFTQSIFFRNDQVDRELAGDEMFYRNILIEDNVIINAHLHGITVGETDGLTIRRNTVVHNPMSGGPNARRNVWVPQVRVAEASKNVSITDNAVNKVVGFEEQTDWVLERNLLLQDERPNDLNHYSALFAEAIQGDPRKVSSYRYLAGGALDATGIGSPLLQSGLTGRVASLVAKSESRVLPQVLMTSLPEGQLIFALDASATVFPQGTSDADIVYRWSFPDGTTSAGRRVFHDFTGQDRSFELALVQINGDILISRFRFNRTGEIVLEMDPVNGSFVSYASGSPLTSALAAPSFPMRIGQGAEVATIPRRDIMPLFQSDDFDLRMSLKTVGAHNGEGQLLYMHHALDVSVGGRGIVTVVFTTIDGQEFQLASLPTDLLDGNWHDLRLRYSQSEAALQIYMDDKLVGEREASGLYPAMEFWGLSFGHPFGHEKSYDGELRGLKLSVDRGSFIPTTF